MIDIQKLSEQLKEIALVGMGEKVERITVLNIATQIGGTNPKNFEVEIVTDSFVAFKTSVFLSHGKIVAVKHNGFTILDDYAIEYSAQTLKSLKAFLVTTATKSGIKDRVANGTYKTFKFN